MNNKDKIKITLISLLFIAVILFLLFLSFFGGYSVFLSMLLGLSTHTLNTVTCIIGIFIIQIIGVCAWRVIKMAFYKYREKTGFKIEKRK